MSRMCNRCRHELAGRAPGVPPPTREIQAHLDDCAECRRWQAEDTATWELVGALAEPVVPAGLAARVAGGVAEKTGRGRWGLALRLLLAGATVAGALVGLWLGTSLAGATLEQEVPESPEAAFASVFDAAPPGSLDLSSSGAAEHGRFP